MGGPCEDKRVINRQVCVAAIGCGKSSPPLCQWFCLCPAYILAGFEDDKSCFFVFLFCLLKGRSAVERGKEQERRRKEEEEA